MATQGYDPHLTLARFYFGKQDITDSEMLKAKSVIGYCVEHQLHSVKTSLLSRFSEIILKERGKALLIFSSHEADLVQGLLDCLDLYHPYSAYTDPRSIQGSQTGGIYDHFKGGVYLIRGHSLWASGNGEPVVEYLSMLFGTKHTRLVSQWCEVVKWPDGKYRSRFVYRGADLTVPEPKFKVSSPLRPAS